jgi:site-specific DNA-methyltransferase (adenine-specific)
MRLIHGDCLTEMDLLIGEGVKVDMILCDLPYGTTQCRWDTVIPFKPLWERYEKLIKDNGAILLFSSQPFTSALVQSNRKLFRYEWIWQKTNPKGHLNAKKMPMRAHENILVFYKTLPAYNPQMTHGHRHITRRSRYERSKDGTSCYGREIRDTVYDSADRYPLDVQVFSNGNQISKLHPTQKPVELCEYLIKTYTNEGELVLDNCMGSGTTGVACRNLNRKFIGIESDQHYFNVAEKRITEVTDCRTLD